MEINLHTAQIKYSKHALRELRRWFGPDPAYISNIIKTGKLVRKIKKEGAVGTIEKSTKKGKVVIEFTYRQGVIYIITVKSR